jgi:hypothetical protein
VTHFASLREVTPRVDDAKVRKRMRRHRHLSVRPLVQPLPARPRRTATWRQGTRGAMRSRLSIRVRPAHRDDWRATMRSERSKS